MARGRMISKAISLDEKVDSLSNDTVRLLFTWLIPHLDCEGRMYGDPQTVKSITFPRRHMDVRTVQKYLDELVESGLIQRYTNGGSTFICCPNFQKHQVGLNKKKETPSQIPPPPTEKLRNEDGISPAQIKEEIKVKVKVKEESKEESSSSPQNENLITEEDAIEAYEKNIGDPSEDIENEIKLATKRFTPQWVIDAIKEAGKHNKKSWVYIAGILKNWERYGKDAIRNKGSPNPDKYVGGKYGKSVRR